jgi:hypothetical protein
MKKKLLVLTTLALFALVQPPVYAADSYAPAPVRLQCTSTDPVGRAFCYQLEEGLIASHQFKLVNQAPSWVIHAVTVDDSVGLHGYSTSIGITFTWSGAANIPEAYMTANVLTAGAANVQQLVQATLSDLSAEVNMLSSR